MTGSLARAARRPLPRFLSAVAVAALAAGSLTTGAAPAQAAALPSGAIKAAYDRSGGARGAYGALQTGEIHDDQVRGLVYAKTYNASSHQWYWLTWSRDHGVVPVKTTGAIGHRWEAERAADGLPLSAETVSGNRAATERFQNADLAWSPSDKTHRVQGAVRGLWERSGGQNGSLGTPTSEETAAYSGSREQTFDRGTVVWSPRHGAVAMSAGVGTAWGKDPAAHGLPVSSTIHGGRLVTTFEKDSLAFYPERGGLAMRTDKVLGAHDAVVVGDSQLANGDTRDWVVSALKQDGYTAWTEARGGIGFTTDPDLSYFNGVVGNRWTLPVGTPGLIYVQSSGNDRNADPAKLEAAATTTISTLRQAYPGAKVVVAGVLSRKGGSAVDREMNTAAGRFNSAAKRDAVSAITQKVAAGQKARFVPLDGKITEWEVESLLGDHVHFVDGKGNPDWSRHAVAAADYAPYLKKYLG